MISYKNKQIQIIYFYHKIMKGKLTNTIITSDGFKRHLDT